MRAENIELSDEGRFTKQWQDHLQILPVAAAKSAAGEVNECYSHYERVLVNESRLPMGRLIPPNLDIVLAAPKLQYRKVEQPLSVCKAELLSPQK